MRKLFVALAAMTLNGAAMAADVDVAAPIYRVRAVAPFNWTGFYIGVHGGGDWFNKTWFAPLSPTNAAAGCTLLCPGGAGSHSASSWLAGGQVGFNYQIAWFVAGAEAQISATRLEASHNFTPTTLALNTKTNTLGTFAARIGIAMDRTMFFLKGGGAFAHDEFWSSTAAAPTFQSATDTRWGWMIGVGFEWAFLDNWSVKVEYDHLEFRRHREPLLPVGAGAFAFDFDIEQTVDLVKVGVNYKFGYAPVVARY